MNNLLIIAAVAAAVGYFIWHNLGKRKNGSGCGSGCDCASEKKKPVTGFKKDRTL